MSNFSKTPQTSSLAYPQLRDQTYYRSFTRSNCGAGIRDIRHAGSYQDATGEDAAVFRLDTNSIISMAQNLEDLRHGKYVGYKKLKLMCGLTELPLEVFDLAPTLEVLDISGNRLAALPPNFIRLQNLRILFCSDNCFRQYPEILSQIPALEMVAFKNNGMKIIPELSFGTGLRWLILTNNELVSLPKSIGHCSRIQKLMLAGNQLKELPQEMSKLDNLALLRLSANNLTHIPDWLFHLPNLAFLAFAGNPCSRTQGIAFSLPEVDWADLQIQSILGEGASGVIYSAKWVSAQQSVALKLFKGEVTSDGSPRDEMNACINAGSHPNLINTIGRIRGHIEGKEGLILQLIPPTYTILGQPPSLTSCTRDIYAQGLEFSSSVICSILTSIASAAVHMHARGISHGDLYAHNTLINVKGHALLGDFGAATCYGPGHVMKSQIERIEVLAFGHLVEDLCAHCKEEEQENKCLKNLNQLWLSCVNKSVDARPSFADIAARLQIVD